MTPRNEFFRSLQAMRFVAALMVVVCHGFFFTHAEPGFSFAVWRQGSRGVDLFFVISGFVMAMTSDDLRDRRHGYLDFAFKRIIRIVPLYWLVTTFAIGLIIVMAPAKIPGELTWHRVLFSYLFLPTADSGTGRFEPIHGVGWTLTFEMFFYAVFAVALAVRRSPLVVCTAVMLICTALSLLRPTSYPGWMSYFDPLVLEFAFGLFVAQAVKLGYRLPAGLAVVLLVGCLVWICVVPGNRSITHALWIGLPSAGAVFAAVSLEPVIGGMIPRWMLFFGNASYSLYLIHPLVGRLPPMVLARYELYNVPLSVLLTIGISLIASALLYRFLELPTLRYLRGLRASETPSHAVDPPPTERGFSHPN